VHAVVRFSSLVHCDRKFGSKSCSSIYAYICSMETLDNLRTSKCCLRSLDPEYCSITTDTAATVKA